METPTHMEPEQLLQAAREIGESLREKSLRTPSGAATWLGPTGYGTELNPLRLLQMGSYLYDGTSGVAFFLAALARATGDDTYRELAQRTLSPLRDRLLELAAAPERAQRLGVPLGGLLGLGSYIYALLRVGTLLEDRSYVDAAHAATQMVTPERISRDERVRLQTGSAGGILALLALHQERPEPNASGHTPLELAALCARHLLGGRVSFEGRPKAWQLSPGKPPLGGFSYGAAGISHALLRVGALVPEEELHAAATEGLAFLDGLYSPEHGNWRDIRATVQARIQKPDDSTWKDFWLQDFDDPAKSPLTEFIREDARPGPLVDSFQDSWCHGNTGIVLGQLASLSWVDTPGVREQLSRTLSYLSDLSGPEQFARKAEDDLCCGNMGRADVLLQASLVLGEARWREAAEALASRVWERARKAGRYVVSASRGSDVFAPSLFQGVAGVGYVFLRLSAPRTLPCVLLLE